MSSPPSIRPWRAIAHSNIALVKYWGKRPSPIADLNLPAVSSLSLTLDELRTETEVMPGNRDRFVLNDAAIEGSTAQKVFRHLDRVWQCDGRSEARPACAVHSTNYLPTAGGLASSASGFAALTLAAAGAFQGPTDPATLSSLARRGSGSAARSIWGGMVELQRGEREDGSDCLANPIFARDFWPELRLVIVHTARGPKPLGSTGGMERCRETSPYYPAWVESSEADIVAAKHAIEQRNLPELGRVMEHSCFKMHACMMATQPAIIYWNASTLAVMHRLQELRAEGLSAFATSDAGPHVKILCCAPDDERLAQQLSTIAGVHRVQSVKIGPDASAKAL